MEILSAQISVARIAVSPEVIPLLKIQPNVPTEQERDEDVSRDDAEDYAAGSDDDCDPDGDDERGALFEKHAQETARRMSTVERRNGDQIEDAPADVGCPKRRHQRLHHRIGLKPWNSLIKKNRHDRENETRERAGDADD